MQGQVLVLNASFEPLGVVSTYRAVILLLKEKAEVIEALDAALRTPNRTFPRPSVIRLVYYVRLPRHLGVPLNRRTLLIRDRYTCQYCGRRFPSEQLTMDHVLPRSRGGKTTWSNVVTACKRCNQYKSNRTPEEANMKLIRKPYRPRYLALVAMGNTNLREVWEKYLF